MTYIVLVNQNSLVFFFFVSRDSIQPNPFSLSDLQTATTDVKRLCVKKVIMLK